MHQATKNYNLPPLHLAILASALYFMLSAIAAPYFFSVFGRLSSCDLPAFTLLFSPGTAFYWSAATIIWLLYFLQWKGMLGRKMTTNITCIVTFVVVALFIYAMYVPIWTYSSLVESSGHDYAISSSCGVRWVFHPFECRLLAGR